MLRRGKLPPVPEALLDADYDIVYISPLAKAQRAVQAKDTQTFLAIVGGMAELMPDIIDTINGDKVVDKLAKIYSIDPEILRSEDEKDSIRQQRSDQQAMQQKMMMMDQLANTAKTGSEAQRNGAEADAKAKE